MSGSAGAEVGRPEPMLYRWPRTEIIGKGPDGFRAENPTGSGGQTSAASAPSSDAIFVFDRIRLRLLTSVDRVRTAGVGMSAQQALTELQEALDHLAADVDDGLRTVGDAVRNVLLREDDVAIARRARLVMERLGLERLVIARLLLSLVDHPGRLYLPARAADGKVDRSAGRRSRVYISMLRRALRSRGFEHAIETVGGGYRIAQETAVRIAALWERAEGDAQ